MADAADITQERDMYPALAVSVGCRVFVKSSERLFSPRHRGRFGVVLRLNSVSEPAKDTGLWYVLLDATKCAKEKVVCLWGYELFVEASAESPASAPVSAEPAPVAALLQPTGECLNCEERLPLGLQREHSRLGNDKEVARWSEERKAKARKTRAINRIKQQAPLFADELIERQGE